MNKTFLRVALSVVFFAVLALAVGHLLADRLMPTDLGSPSHAMPVQPGESALDRSIAPLLAAHPGQSGAAAVVDGIDAFAVRALSARGASRSIDVMYYIWEDDLTGRLIDRELWLAAERGVRVRILLDDWTLFGQDQNLLLLDSHPNIEVRLYNPFRKRSALARLGEIMLRAVRINHRLHGKLWIADSRLAITGGRNIGNEYFNAATQFNFHDLDLALMGVAVAQSDAIFDRYWNSDVVVPLASVAAVDPERLRQRMREIRQEARGEAAQVYLARVNSSPGVAAFLAGRLQSVWTSNLEVVADPPEKWSGKDRDQWIIGPILADIAGARRDAWLISPYFVPRQSGTRLLVDLAKRGVDTGVVTNSLASNDVVMTQGGYARRRDALLAGGVKLYELRASSGAVATGFFGSKASLHTKAYVIDGHEGFVGSFNLDPRSANLNAETGVFFDDRALAAEVAAEYQRLASPAMSYRPFLNAAGEVRWEDASTRPPRVLAHDPDTGWWKRTRAWVARWLPVESQL